MPLEVEERLRGFRKRGCITIVWFGKPARWDGLSVEVLQDFAAKYWEMKS